MITAEITNTCTCQYCQDCGCTYNYVDSNECPECQSEMEQTDCYGACYEETRDDILDHIIGAWLGDEQPYHIQGTHMGWTRASGSTQTLTKPEDGLRELDINTLWTIKFTLDNGNLTAVRYSHDEPTGASFTYIKGEAQ